MTDFLVPGCDASTPSIYVAGYDDFGNAVYTCRCVVCARCDHHTGNSHQGHFWKMCKVTKSMRDFHFCCPNNCELEQNSDR